LACASIFSAELGSGTIRQLFFEGAGFQPAPFSLMSQFQIQAMGSFKIRDLKAQGLPIPQGRLGAALYWKFYNIFNTTNTGNNVNAVCGIGFTSSSGAPCDPSFGTAVGYFRGEGFGAPNGGPLRSQFGLRLEFL
jgi:hypothetical protein